MNSLLETLPSIHAIAVFLSICLYIARGILAFSGSKGANKGLLVTLSAVTILTVFISGVMMGFALQLPFTSGYIITSLAGLIIYVALGVLAFKPHQGKGTVAALWIAGIVVFIYTYQVSAHFIKPLF